MGMIGGRALASVLSGMLFALGGVPAKIYAADSGNMYLHCRLSSLESGTNVSREVDISINFSSQTANGWAAVITDDSIAWTLEGDYKEPINWNINRHSGTGRVVVGRGIVATAMEGPCEEVKAKKF